MAVLKKLVVQDFRNIALAELEFSSNINCISGGNGEGKTNLIDAIYYMSMTKSSSNASDRACIRYGAESFSISGLYSMKSADSRFSLRVSGNGAKKLVRDEKPCQRMSDHIGLLPVVLVSPSDGALVSDSGEERRKFLNQVLSQMDSEYLADVQQYNKLISQRNAMLREESSDVSLMEIIEESLEYHGHRIHERRKSFVETLSPAVGHYYSILSGGKEEVRVSYRSDLSSSSLRSLLEASRQKDRILGYTTSGIQRDDLIFLMDGHPIRRDGSQGQRKSFLIALKFAQYELMKQESGVPPTLLLDDVFDKLDMDRTSNLLGLVAGSDFGQIFITDSNKVRLSGIVDGVTADRAYYSASAGCFTMEEI